MKIVLATNNKHKITEMNSMLCDMGNIEVLSLTDVGYNYDIVENGKTFEENSIIKAKTVSDFTGLISIADDSGLTVDALGGEPGILSARYSGEFSNDDKNNEKLLKNLSDITSLSDRIARFVSVITAYFPNGEYITARGECEGLILFEKRGDGLFGYDPLFYHKQTQKTFAEMTESEKNAVSHRGVAMKRFIEKFSKIK